MDDFLKYGAMGLILALSVLVYRLVRVEQGKVRPSEKNYYGIFVFIGFALIVMFIGIGLELSKDKSHPKKLYAWIHHNRNGFCIDLPDIFEEKIVTPTLIAFKSHLDSKIELRIDCALCQKVTTPELYLQFYNQKLNENESITYQFYKDAYFVISGFRENGNVYYYKGLLKNTAFYFMALEFPAKYKDVFDEITGRISLSFK